MCIKIIQQFYIITMIKLTNANYNATVVEIKTLVQLENCDNVQAAIIMGNQVIVSKDTKIGEIGLFFPVETQLSKEYLSVNNLYRDSKLNVDKNKKGHFELNGRIRCVKFRGNKSEGLFMPIASLHNLVDLGLTKSTIVELKLNVSFNEVECIEICKKYTPKSTKTPGQSGSKTKGKASKKSQIVENQFRFHNDTGQLYRNLHRINTNSLISITYKIHGTSGISSKILVNKNLNWYEKALIKLGVKIQTQEYSIITASRTVIKSETSDPGFYGEDIWKIASKHLENYLVNGMTFYYEICGYTPSGKFIQKDYDYGCTKPLSDEYIEGINYKIFIYRITQTNIDGKVFEFSAKQVQDWCKKNGLNAVPELYYGYASDLTCEHRYDLYYKDVDFKDAFLDEVKRLYNEKDCYLCKNKLSEEGCVVRIEGLELEAYKCKSVRFLEKETLQLDKGEIDIESEN